MHLSTSTWYCWAAGQGIEWDWWVKTFLFELKTFWFFVVVKMSLCSSEFLQFASRLIGGSCRLDRLCSPLCSKAWWLSPSTTKFESVMLLLLPCVQLSSISTLTVFRKIQYCRFLKLLRWIVFVQFSFCDSKCFFESRFFSWPTGSIWIVWRSCWYPLSLKLLRLIMSLRQSSFQKIIATALVSNSVFSLCGSFSHCLFFFVYIGGIKLRRVAQEFARIHWESVLDVAANHLNPLHPCSASSASFTETLQDFSCSSSETLLTGGMATIQTPNGRFEYSSAAPATSL